MRKKILCWCLLILLVLPLPAMASFSDDIAQFKQKYSDIYNNIDPVISAKMDSFLPDVVDYVVVNYDSSKTIDVQIANAVGSVLLTGDTYKNDLLPFMTEQAANKELYRAQLIEMKAIVRTEVEARLNLLYPSIQKAVINKGEQLVEMDISFLTSARMANVFVFNEQGKFIIPSYIKSSNGNYYSFSDFTSARMAAAGGTVSGGLALLNDDPMHIRSIQTCTVTYENNQFVIVPPVTGSSLTGITN